MPEPNAIPAAPTKRAVGVFVGTAYPRILGILGAEDLSVSVTPPVGAPINPAFAVSVTCGVPETLLSHPVTIEVPNGATITFTV